MTGSFGNGRAEGTMANPFDDPEGVYLVLVTEGQEHSLWPRDVEVPAGWSPVFGPAARDACVGYVEAHWTQLRPAAVRAAR